MARMAMNDLVGAILITGIIVVVILGKVLRGPIGEALADRLRGHPGPSPAALTDLEDVKTRLAEVEERLDFAERLLAQGEQPNRLPGRTDR
jgi:hypothetical protein